MAAEETKKIYKIYVKRLPNGNLYLGRTEKDPYKYMGSGTIWKRTIKKYNYKLKDIETWVLYETDSFEDLKIVGLCYSKLLNIVESDAWLNLIDETGEGLHNPSYELRQRLSIAKLGVKRKPFTEETLKRFSEAKIGKKLSKKHYDNVVAANKSDIAREKRRKAATGIITSEETKKKISEKIKEKWKTGEYSNRIKRKNYAGKLLV